MRGSAGPSVELSPASPTGSALSAGRLAILLGAGFAVAATVMGLCSLVGVAPLSAGVWQLRLTRLAAGAIVGAGLSAGGVALQGQLRNPLAEPYILGISSGAGVGVMLGLALSARIALPGWLTTPVLALGGALATCGAVYAVAQRRGKLDPYALLLSGVIVNAFNGAVMLAIYLFIDPYRTANFIRWAMGQVDAAVGLWLLALAAGVTLAGWAVLLLRGGALNALGLGDEVATSLGVPVGRLRLETFVVVAALTSVAVALAGPIGFVGLVVPHLCRLVLGPDHRRLLAVAPFVGAALLMAADTLCRSVDAIFSAASMELRLGQVPVGILTALLGVPAFIILLRAKLKGGPW